MRIDRAESEAELLGSPASSAEIVKVVAGDFEIRLAQSRAEIDAAQALRYRVFYEEMKARPTAEMASSRRDFDGYDEVCDHLLVLDRRRGEGPEGVVGTYRLIRRAASVEMDGFYSTAEYDIKPMIDYPGEVLELGRSCIEKTARNTTTMQMLWRGIALYAFHYNVKVMFGCASFAGTDPVQHALPLSYLHDHHLAPPDIRVRAQPERFVKMDTLVPGSYDARRALSRVPPLIKGYLRLGGFVGDGAVIDEQFNTVDVFIIVKTELVTEKYIRHYERGMRESDD
jgi:putative hemolysin